MVKRLISRLTMVKTKQLFLDVVNKCVVYEWVDYYGQKFTAQTRFGTRLKK